VRHANAREVDVSILLEAGGVLLRVTDDGRGLARSMSPERLEVTGHMGLAGMRERITALGGTVRLQPRNGTGAQLEVAIPAGSPAHLA